MTEKRTLEDCARCGSCKARCPVYDIAKNEALSPRGRLMLMKGLAEGELAAGPGLAGRLMSCALCGICDTSCPVGIKPTRFIYKGRALLRKADRKRLLLRMAVKAGLKNPALGLKAARLLKGFKGLQLLFPLNLELPANPLRDEAQVIKPKKPRGRVGLFAGCSTNYLMPSTGESLISMLLAMGYEVVLPRGEVCCGVPLLGLGMEEEARKYAARNLEIFGRMNAEAVLSPCPTCTLALREHFRELTGQAVENAVDAVEFVASRLPENGALAGGKLKIWHEPCHSRYGLGLDHSDLLKRLDIKVKETGCCGFGLLLADRALSAEFLAKRAESYKGADTVVTSCPACIIQLRQGGMNAVHLLQLIEEAFFPEEAGGG